MVLPAALADRHGTLFSAEAPTWSSKVILASIFVIFYVAVRRAFSRATRGNYQDNAVSSTLGLSVSVEVSSGIFSTWDHGAAEVVDGQLVFSGKHSSFKVGLQELDVLKLDRYEPKLKLRMSPTKQRIAIQGLGNDHEDWHRFVASLELEPQAAMTPSIYPPKPAPVKLPDWITIFIFATLIMIFEGIISLSWSLSAIFPSIRELSFAVAFAAGIVASTWAFLSIDARLWKRRRLAYSRP